MSIFMVFRIPIRDMFNIPFERQYKATRDGHRPRIDPNQGSMIKINMVTKHDRSILVPQPVNNPIVNMRSSSHIFNARVCRISHISLDYYMIVEYNSSVF